ncbi:MAG: SDR family oxidoreductase [Bacteroidia bacterium]|nr:SDR family oxidoreductase [Bacteroidia bacterium]MBT8269073.1 SDR family oxidoreductase [Bacteroidia bacterium]NNF81139.1 SDR family oxidoreductase [Flavobacteriaceae bacterium]NNK69856.1 SDR family oxidoreductase [Flavobacteriaceae bacterium]NNL81046.1 SDR family oxidoreductase [Flavobacteriaceae bacterium]
MNRKHIIITGTSRGIGFEMVHLLASAGHDILALSRNARPVKNLEFDHIYSMAFDLHASEDYRKVEEYVEKEWNNSVDILINNAGLLINKPFEQTTKEDFIDVYQTNVFGVAELTRTVIPYMSSESHVVTVSSMGGVQGSMKFPGLAAYSSSKGAVITLTELLAEEYKETGPSFNVLALGAVQTEMLAEAFPGYKAPLSALEMAKYISDFALNGHNFYNGKLLQVSSSTP